MTEHESDATRTWGALANSQRHPKKSHYSPSSISHCRVRHPCGVAVVQEVAWQKPEVTVRVESAGRGDITVEVGPEDDPVSLAGKIKSAIEQCDSVSPG